MSIPHIVGCPYQGRNVYVALPYSENQAVCKVCWEVALYNLANAETMDDTDRPVHYYRANVPALHEDHRTIFQFILRTTSRRLVGSTTPHTALMYSRYGGYVTRQELILFEQRYGV